MNGCSGIPIILSESTLKRKKTWPEISERKKTLMRALLEKIPRICKFELTERLGGEGSDEKLEKQTSKKLWLCSHRSWNCKKLKELGLRFIEIRVHLSWPNLNFSPTSKKKVCYWEFGANLLNWISYLKRVILSWSISYWSVKSWI